jgi:hypothetical protein
VVSRLADLILNISQVSIQQASTSANIAHSMTEISSLTQEATALRRQSNEVVDMVARTAEDLRNSVSAFKVTTDNEPYIDTALGTPKQESGQYLPSTFQFAPPPAPEVPQPIATNGFEDKAELNSMLSEDSDFFDSIFGEVATASPGMPKPGEKDKPQALG